MDTIDTHGPWGRPGGRRGHHPHRHPEAFADESGRGHRRYGGRGRAPRGDVRTAVLLLLAEEPMHGYQLMQAIAERTGGTWAPSPGAIYPTINQLEDEGLVAITAEAGRKLVRLTASGRELLEANRDSWVDPFAGFDPTAPGTDLRRLMHELHEATRQVGRAGTDAQREAAAKILTDARRELYLLLAAEPGNPGA
jgi:DNA-binding PadR family transcriptional regulator